MESETRPNKADREGGQTETFDRVKVAQRVRLDYLYDLMISDEIEVNARANRLAVSASAL